MVILVVPQPSRLLKPGLYAAALVAVEERTGQNGTYLEWRFEIAGTNGQVVKRPTSTSFGPQANARKIVEALIGRPLDVGETVEAEDLLGLPCQLAIETTTLADGRQVNRISSVLPASDASVPF